MRRFPLALAVGLTLATSMLAMNTVRFVDEKKEDRWKRLPRRYWEDVYLAIGHHMTGEFPVSNLSWRGFRTGNTRGFREARPTLSAAATDAAMRSWEFWRTVPTTAFERRRPPPITQRYDDPGRSLLLSYGFSLLGGVSPFLIFWLGLLFATPVVAWVSVELALGERPAGALLFPAGLAVFPYVSDLLALPYSAVGFYFIGLLCLTAWGTYAVLHPSPSLGGLAARSAVAGVTLAVCTLARASALMALPGFLFAGIVLAIRWRRRGTAWREVASGAATALLLLILPYVVLVGAVNVSVERTLASGRRGPSASPQVHPVWHGIWIGLGDFDREKGYVFDDQAAFRAALDAGGYASTTQNYDPRNEAVYRRMIFDDIREDPVWFLGILGSRIDATLLQRKLWPMASRDGRAIRAASHPNEGAVDAYYTLTTPIDRIGLGPKRYELPVGLLLAGPLALLAWLVAVRRPRGAGAQADLALVGCVAVGALGHPVAVTTASALECQAILVVYVLAGVLLVDRVANLIRSRQPEAA